MKIVNILVKQLNTAKSKIKNTYSICDLILSIPHNVFAKTIYIIILFWIYTPILMMVYSIFLKNTDQFQLLLNNSLITIEWFTRLQQLGLLSLIVVVLFIIKVLLKKKEASLIDFIIKIKRNLSFVLFFLLLLMSIISCISSDNISLSFYGDKYRRDGLVSYFCYFAIFASAYFLRDEKKVKNTIKHLTHVAALLSLLTMLNIEAINLLFGLSNNKAIFNNINHFAYFLCLASMCSILPIMTSKRLKDSIFSIIEYALIVAALARNQSLGPYLAVLVGLLLISILIIMLKKAYIKRLILVLSIFILISVMINISYGHILANFLVMRNDINSILSDPNNAFDAGTNRWGLWLNGIEFAKQKPWFGYGPDNLGEQYSLLDISYDRPHNILIQIAASLGIPALIFFLLALLVHFYQYIKLRKSLSILNLCLISAVVAYLTSSLFGNSMFYTTPFFCIIMGFSLGTLKEKLLDKR